MAGDVPNHHELVIKKRAGTESLFRQWFGPTLGRSMYRRFCLAFPKTGNGWAHSMENLRQNVMCWSGIRDCRSQEVSAGNEHPPKGNWVQYEEHPTAILHLGFLRYLPVLVTPKHETIPCSVARSKIQKEMEFISPKPIDALAAKVGGQDGR